MPLSSRVAFISVPVGSALAVGSPLNSYFVNRHAYAGRFVATEAEPVIADAYFDGIAQRGYGKDLDLLAFDQSHFQKSLK
jgi:hypothetical protein